jgi:hypothetical protein
MTAGRSAQRADAAVERGQRDRLEAPVGGHRDQLDLDLRDHAERALRADEELRQLRPDGVARHVDRVDHVALRGDDAQGDDLVLDLPVARREDARPARRDVAADRGPLGRGGEVREREAALVQAGLELAPVQAGLDRRGERDLVDLDDLVHPGHVDHDAAGVGHGGAHHARAAAAGDDRHPVGGREPQRRRHLLVARGAHHGVRQVRPALLLGIECRPRPITRAASAIAGVRRRAGHLPGEVVEEGGGGGRLRHGSLSGQGHV